MAIQHIIGFSIAFGLLLGGCAPDRGDGTGGTGLTTSSGGGTDDDDSGDDSGAPTTDGGSGDDSDGTDTGDSGDGDGDLKFDVGVPDGGVGDGGGDGDGELTGYIWIANSGQSPATVSKINTDTMIEEGRYMTRPDGAGSPSRTSVNLNGNMAVANRNGGVTKILGTTSECPDNNANGIVDTSSGAGDIKQWGTDECVVWHNPLQCGSNRPMAWTQGTYDVGSGKYLNPKLWTACDGNVLRLNGETGMVEDTVPVGAGGMLYGGAVDAGGNLWVVNTGNGMLHRVDFQTLAVKDWQPPAGPIYGLAVDSNSRPWLCGGGHASRFDPINETWQHTPGATSGIGGCMTDGAGTLYHSDGSGVMKAIDTDTVMPVAGYPLPAYVHGVSIDFSGRVWGVTFTGSQAFRLDVVTGVVDTFDGLVGAYTYSDMTGFALSSVGNPQG